MKNIYIMTISIMVMLTFMSGAAMAAVWTDQQDYTPGSIVTISGNNNDGVGYSNGETVNVSVNGPYNYDSKCSGIADVNGAWSCQVTLSSDGTAVGQYIYTAVGQTSGVTQSGTFTDGFAVQFVETGLPSGISWNATLNGNTKTATTPANVAFGNQGLGSYTYSVPTISVANIKYVPTPSSGSFSLTESSSNPYQISIGFTTQYQVSFAINPSGGGLTNPSSANYYNTGSTISISATANTGYIFSSWSTSTSAIIISSTTSSSTTATINGPGTITANFVLADNTPPEITPAISGTLGSNDWYISDIMVSWTVTDPESAIISKSGCDSTTINSDTNGQTLTCQAVSSGGTNSRLVTIKRDITKPTLTFGTATPAPNAGWNKDDVSVPYTVDDSYSGVDPTTPSGTLVLTAEGSSVTGTVTVKDNAGNTNTYTSPAYKIDKTAPIITLNSAMDSCSLSGNAGWCRDTQTAGFSASDGLSDLANPSKSSFTQSTTDNGASVYIPSGQICDVAGNCNNGINAGPYKIDSVTPTISGSRTPVANANGWNNVDVIAHFNCNDATSGVTSCTPDTTISTEGTGQIVTGTATDAAGNVGSTVVGDINIDKTLPTITASASTTDGVYTSGTWTNKDVTVSFSCSDDRSGVASCDSPVIKSGEGSGQSATGSVTDKAGNTVSTTFSTLNIDKTSPTVEVTNLNSGSYTLGSVPTSSCTDSDSLSGINTDATVAITGGTVNGVGEFTATCSGATDKAGNLAGPVSKKYNVMYGGESGILQPIDPDGSSLFSRGRAVPIKFKVTGDEFFGFNTVGWTLQRVLVSCSSGSGTDVENVASTTPSTSFRYDSAADQYIYNADFRDKNVGTCWKVQATLDDKSTMTSAIFKLAR